MLPAIIIVVFMCSNAEATFFMFFLLIIISLFSISLCVSLFVYFGSSFNGAGALVVGAIYLDMWYLLLGFDSILFYVIDRQQQQQYCVSFLK